MCVIFYANGKARPTDEMITRAWDSNKDGGGIAHRDGRDVVWKKGIMDLDTFRKMIHAAPLPFIAHFRVASCGGVKPTLTHPFPIGTRASLALEGRTRGGVLFQNGHWTPWQEKSVDAAIHSNTKLPLGQDWSDTRALAFMVAIYGPGLLDLLPQQRAIIMTPENTYTFTGPGWVKINEIWCSNDIFWYGKRHNHHGGHGGYTVPNRYCSRGRCMKQALPGKDVCKDCEDARQSEANSNALLTDGSIPEKKDKTPTAMQILTGGANRPLASVLTLRELEEHYSSKSMSKSKYKKFKKLYNQLGQGTNRKKLRVLGALEILSEEIAQNVIERLSRGSTAGGTA